MHYKRTLLALAAAGLAGTAVLSANEKTTEITTTSTLVTKTIIKEKAKCSPFKVCVLDFTTVDMIGQNMLNTQNAQIVVPPQTTLTEEDRKSMNGVMQGFVRMIDAWDNTKSNDANRTAQISDNLFNREKALELYNLTVKGEARPVLIGAEYLAAYLGRRNDVFSCVDRQIVSAAMTKLQSAPDFPANFMLQLARETGATHLIYGTVSDIRKKQNSFKGYGIETKTVNFQLDVIIKMVDLAAQRTVYSNVYTGNYREQHPVSEAQLDKNIFQNLMTSALEQAAEDLYDQCRPGRKNTVSVTPIPFQLTVIPSGGLFFSAANAKVSVDGTPVGSGRSTCLLVPGKHTVEVSAPGYRKTVTEINLSADQTINVMLEKQ